MIVVRWWLLISCNSFLSLVWIYKDSVMNNLDVGGLGQMDLIELEGVMWKWWEDINSGARESQALYFPLDGCHRLVVFVMGISRGAK